MSLRDLKGNERIAERLVQALQADRLSHACLFEGEARTGKRELADNLAKAILCGRHSGDACDSCPSCRKIDHGNHEDLIYVGAEAGTIKDEEIEELQSRIKKKPLVGERNVVIIDRADTMTARAQNRLLKTLEEPAGRTVLMLLAENCENLARTVLSRCVIYRLQAAPGMEPSDERDRAIAVADRILSGVPFYEIAGQIVELAGDKAGAAAFLDTLEHWYRDIVVEELGGCSQLVYNRDRRDDLARAGSLYKKEDIFRIIHVIEEARRDLNRNMNAGYVLKHAILEIQSS